MTVTTTLPHSLDAEAFLISCCALDDGKTLAQARAAGITPASFYDERHRIVFDVLCHLAERSIPLGADTVAEELTTTKQLEAVGGFAFITGAFRTEATTAQAPYYIERVSDLARRRNAIRAAEQAVQSLRDEAQPIADALAPLTPTIADAGQTLSTGAKPFALWRPKQFLEFQPDPSACLLGAGFLEQGEWTSLVGVGGLGKTRLALWLTICQITGRSWCGIPTGGRPQDAVILSTENGVRRWKHDLEKMLAPLADSERDAIDTHLRILALTPDEEGDLCLSNPEVARRLNVTLSEAAPGFVIFDPFADMIDGDENKTSDVVATLRALRMVTRTACPAAAVLIIHHARSGANNVAQAGDNFNAGNFGRGSKALFSRVRCELQLAPQDREDPNRLVLACGKANNAAKFTTRGIVFDPENFSYEMDEDFDLDAWRDDVAGKRRQSTLAIADVVEAVRAKAPKPGDETSTKAVLDELSHTGTSARTVQRQLSAAVKSGYLRPGNKRGLWKLGSKPLNS